jgi:hypothetical protein
VVHGYWKDYLTNQKEGTGEDALGVANNPELLTRWKFSRYLSRETSYKPTSHY